MKISFLGNGSALIRLADYTAKQKNYEHIYIGYSPRHAIGKNPSGLSYEEELFELAKNHKKIKLIKISSLDDDGFSEICSTELQVSIGSPWIYRERHIEMAPFLIHTHCTDLPKYRGGASSSWMLMNGDRKSAVIIYKMSKEIDAGDLIEKKVFYFPEDLRTPEQYTNYVFDKLILALKDFINIFRTNGGYFGNVQKQDESLSTYFPRLSAGINSWINWNWEPHEVASFVNAFSDPYHGAMTRCTSNPNLVLYIKKAELIQEGQSFHPFMNGLIYRKDSDYLYVVCGKKALAIREHYYKENSKDIKKIKLGDRLFTLNQDIQEAMATRVRFNP